MKNNTRPNRIKLSFWTIKDSKNKYLCSIFMSGTNNGPILEDCFFDNNIKLLFKDINIVRWIFKYLFKNWDLFSIELPIKIVKVSIYLKRAGRPIKYYGKEDYSDRWFGTDV